MKRIKLIAMFMAVLIITLPMYTASVFAANAELTVKVSGSNNVEGYRKETDTVKANVNALIYDPATGQYDEITQRQLTINTNPFNSCTTSDSIYYQCYYTAGQDTVSGSQYYDVELRDDAGVKQAEVQDIELTVDKLAPAVVITSISQDEKGINIGYQIADHAASAVDSYGAGLQRIEFWEDNALLNATDFTEYKRTASGTVSAPSRVDSTGNRLFQVIAYDNLFQLGKAERSNVPIDGTKPSFSIMSFSISGQNGKELNTLRSNTKTTVSAKVNITENTGIAYVKADFSELVAAEDKDNYKEISAQLISGEQGPVYTYEWTGIPAAVESGIDEVAITLEAKDTKGNVKKTYIDYDMAVESTAPRVDANSFKIYSGDAEVRYLSPSQGTIDKMVVDIYDENPGVDKGTVSLDLTGIGGSADINPDSCDGQGNTGIYRCAWYDIPITSPKSGNSVKITASDLWGNSGETTISYGVGLDTNPPLIEYFGTMQPAHEDQDVPYNSFASTTELNTIIVQINEPESGIAINNVELNGWGGLFNNAVPDRCDSAGSLWFCYWENITSPPAVKEGDTIEITVKVRDNSGNGAGLESSILYVDTAKPKIKKVALYSVGSLGPVDYHKAMDPLLLIVEVEDASPLEFKGDFFDVSLGGNITGECKPTGDKLWSCELTTSPIPLTGYKKKNFNFGFKDSAGNTITGKEAVVNALLPASELIGAIFEDGNLKIEILETDITTVTPDFWSSSLLKTMPNALDRQTLSLINQRMYFAINLKKRVAAENVKILDMYLDTDSCEGDAVASIETLELMNIAGNTDKTKPFVLANFRKFASDDVKFLSMTCNLNVISRFGDVLIITPEVENVTLGIDFYNMPLGRLADEFENNIDDVKKGWIGPDSWFGKVMQWASLIVKFAKGICTLGNTLNEINIILGILGEILDLTAETAKSTGTGSSADNVAVADCNFEGAFDKEIEDFTQYTGTLCNIVTCKCVHGKQKEKSAKSGCLFDLTNAINEASGWSSVEPLGTGGGVSSQIDLSPYAKADPFKSIVIAIMQACIPGVIYGLEKYRQIQCTWILCMQQEVAAGFPARQCDAARDFLTCKYVTGEVFRALPWVQGYESLIGEIRQLFEDPFAALGFVLGLMCQVFCAPWFPYKIFARDACGLVEMAKLIGKMVGDYKDMITDNKYQEFFGLKGDLCKEID